LIWIAVVGDVDINPPVIIQIRGDNAQAMTEFFTNPAATVTSAKVPSRWL
jgi:hypothetical protein